MSETKVSAYWLSVVSIIFMILLPISNHVWYGRGAKEAMLNCPAPIAQAAPAGIGKPQAAVALGHIEGFPDGCYKVSEDRMRVEIIQCPSSAHPLKLGKRKPALQVEWQEDCKIDEQCPPSTANEVEPTWSTNAHWQQYPIPPYWTCPAGYEQVTGNERFSASKPGEMASGSEDHAHKPKCLLPGVPTPQVPQQ